VTAQTQYLTIREMTEPDIDGLATSLGWPRAGLESRFREQVEGKRDVFVARLDGDAVASVSLNEHPDLPGIIHLFALDVGSSYRRRGIGAVLIQAVEREAARRRLDGVWLDVAVDNEDAMRLYERLGYRREGPTVVNCWSHIDEDGTQQNVEETCYRMFKRFDGRNPA